MTLSIAFRYSIQGGHTHVRVFAGKDEDHRAKCGDLVFRNEEWDLLANALCGASGGDVLVSLIDETRPEGSDEDDDE